MKKWQHRLHSIIYEADTPAGKLFDILLLVTILLSVLFVTLESVTYIDATYGAFLNTAEWVVTILFTLEYIMRIICVQRPWNYIRSFYGIVDLISILPKYISLLIVGTQSLVALKALRLLRVFRILKLTPYIGESNTLLKALNASRAKILVFIFGVIILCIIFGTLMYLIESDSSGFTSIPRSIYWCIVTLTTVGYGDIAPQTPLGQFLASLIMILGYGIIAVPTGIVTAEMTKNSTVDINTQVCPYCMQTEHKENSIHCHQCGKPLNDVK
jgi:voltage-gated potassium channel|tara:strand:- start:3609 stop:4421 length:813 start_codon:yes stop_codon:yes gene_type:complete